MRRRVFRGLMLFAAAGVLAAAVTAQAPVPYDLVIRGGQVLDGAGNPWVVADVAVRQDGIVAVGPGLTGRGRREIDARGLVVSPGFITRTRTPGEGSSRSRPPTTTSGRA